MDIKPDSTVSLYEVLLYLRNFFPGERCTCSGTPIQQGVAQIPCLEEGDYYLIEGSKCNDGLHIYGDCDLVGEMLTGYITECRIPPALLSLYTEINYWQKKNAEAITSPYQSESFGGYSYTKKSQTNSSGDVSSWQDAFSRRLRMWRKI